MTQNPINQYRAVDTSGHVETANPHKLIEMLYAGLKDALHAVHRAIEFGHVAAKAKALGKSLDILQTLQMSLDPQAGGTVADNMASLYDYMERRITEANLHNDSKAIEEVLALTESLRESWETIPVNLRHGTIAA